MTSRTGRGGRPPSPLPRWALTALLVAAFAPQPALGQMPDLRTMSGRPLPVPDLAPGTVTVRVVRQTPANAAAGLDVSATLKAPSGDSRLVTVRTGGDGRAQFDGIPAGTQFQAAVTVDGEELSTELFSLPATGGIRIMLIAGLGAAGHEPQAEPAPPGAAPPAAPGRGQTFRMGAPTGSVAPAADLAKGVLVLELRGPGGEPLPGKNVRLGEIRLNQAQDGREVTVHDAVSDGAGLVRFEKLTTGETAGYAAVTEHQGMRLSTHPFRMPVDSGMRGRILALGRTKDPSVLQLDPRSKIVFDLREEALAVMIGLTFRNTSQEIFDAGEEGLVIPLPEGAVNAQEIEGGEPLEVVPGKLVRLKGPIPPDSAASFVTQVRFGYVLPSGGADRMDVRQPFPFSWPDPFLLVPEKTGLALEAPGLKPLSGSEVDGAGDKVKSYTLPAVAAGSTLNLAVVGMPARDRSGRSVAAGICLLLVLGALIWARPSRGSRQAAHADRDSLITRREALFAELVTLEEQRKESPQAGARLADRRKEIIAKLEVVYRDLAALEHH